MVKRDRWEDHFTRKAKDENWLARSVYKLEEIDRHFRLFRPGSRVLDLGCYPGSWSQYSIGRVGPRGEVVGVDLKEPDRFSAPNFRFIKADVLTLDAGWLTDRVSLRDAVTSDLSPKTTGIRPLDTSRSMELAQTALQISLAVLKGKGHFLCKVFEGEDLNVLREEFTRHFHKIRLIRPSAVRRGSREVYLLGLGLQKRV
jgi:23S rRNA (uridine2552-2'-O)-methyltransferase